jgi:hypothetical protein
MFLPLRFDRRFTSLRVRRAAIIANQNRILKPHGAATTTKAGQTRISAVVPLRLRVAERNENLQRLSPPKGSRMLTLGVIGWVIIGGLAGWVGSKLMGTDGRMGIFLNIVGIVGGLIGGFLLRVSHQLLELCRPKAG